MFRPQKETRRLFEIFLAALGHKWKVVALLCVMTRALWQYRLHVLIGVILTSALALGPFVLIWLGWFALPLPGLDLQLVALDPGRLALLFALDICCRLPLFFLASQGLCAKTCAQRFRRLPRLVRRRTGRSRRTSLATYTRVSKSWLAETRARIRR